LNSSNAKTKQKKTNTASFSARANLVSTIFNIISAVERNAALHDSQTPGRVLRFPGQERTRSRADGKHHARPSPVPGAGEKGKKKKKKKSRPRRKFLNVLFRGRRRNEPATKKKEATPVIVRSFPAARHQAAGHFNWSERSHEPLAGTKGPAPCGQFQRNRRTRGITAGSPTEFPNHSIAAGSRRRKSQRVSFVVSNSNPRCTRDFHQPGPGRPPPNPLPIGIGWRG